MGTPYSTQTITGYNSSPPADDGSQVASNLVTWSGQKTKLSDPVKTLAEAINTALVADLNTSSRAVTTTDNVLASDHKKTLQCSGTFTETLLDAATAGAGFQVTVKNAGTGVITVDRATASNTVDTFSSVVTLAPLEAALFVVNAAATGYNIKATCPGRSTQASTFTWDGSGGTSASVTMTYQKVGNFVTLHIPAVTATSGTSSTVLTSDTALPAVIRPAAITQYFAINSILNNGGGVAGSGVIRVSAAGVVDIRRDEASAVFTNSSQCGTVSAQTIFYFLG